jgi:glycosyltransferase involved in cell wall biosynthesis
MKPKVTIGICARNSEKTIGRAIESVVQQDFDHQSMEIVFVDDGSEDNTLEIMKSYVSKIDVTTRIFSGEWRGLGKARNTVINNAQGDYVIWLDSDEIIEKDFVRRQVDLMARNPRAGIATGRLGILAEESVVLVLDLIPNILAHCKHEWKNPSKLPGTGGATYRVSAAKQVGGFDEDIKGTGEDIEMASRMVLAGWQIVQGNPFFYESHGKMATLKTLWIKYFNDGIHGRRLYEKTRILSLYRINPLASFVAGVSYAVDASILMRRKVVLLLPFHYAFKMTAWFYGFTRG